MADWKNEVKPKMEKILLMIGRSPLPRSEIQSIKKDLEPVFLKSPQSSRNPSSSLSVIMDDEVITNFDLREWQDLRKQFMQIFN